MTSYLYAHQIKIFDYAKEFADPMRNRIRENAQMLAKTHGVTIEHVNNARLRKQTWWRSPGSTGVINLVLFIFSRQWKACSPTHLA